MNYISACIILTSKSDLEDVYTQNLEGCEVHIFGKDEFLLGLQLKENIHLHAIDLPKSQIENYCISKCPTKWIMFRYDGEVWGKDFVTDLVYYIKQNDHSLTLKYVEGFYRIDNRLAHVHEVNPKTNSTFSLSKLFQGPRFFIPGIKFIYPLQLITTNNILFDEEIHNTVLRQAIFGVNVLATMYVFAGYTYFPITKQTLPFSVPLVYSKPRQTKEYFVKLIDKHETWSKNKWNRLAWQSLLFKYRFNIPLKK